MNIRISSLVFVLVSGCASPPQTAPAPLNFEKNEAGLRLLEKAAAEHPGDLNLRTRSLRLREELVLASLIRADESLRNHQFEQAENAYRETLRLHPENARAPAGLAAVENARQDQHLLGEAEKALAAKQFNTAETRLRAILARTPDHPGARTLYDRLARATEKNRVDTPELSPEFQRRVTLEFRATPIRLIFDAISAQTGLNFVLDKDIPASAQSTLIVRDTPIAETLDMLLSSNQLARKPVNTHTLLIYPNRPDKRRDYEELMVKSFLLANADAKQVATLVKTMARVRDLYVDEKLNMLIVRDTPNVVRLAEKLVRLADQPEPEVMLEVEIMEVKRSKLLALGVQWPTSLSVMSKERVNTVTSDSNGNTLVTGATYIDVPQTLNLLKHINSGTLLMNTAPGITASKTDGDINILANPRIRVRNKEKAKVHVGDKVPVITANTTANGVVSESVAYLDVGLKLDVEPQVHLEGDVAIKVGMEVSNIVQEVRSGTGTLTYQLGSRNAHTVLRLRDGETQVLAGLISEEDRKGAGKVPGLGDLPILGKLFANQKDEQNKTEIVLLITPHVLRNIERPQLADSEFLAGTENAATITPVSNTPPAGAGNTGAAPLPPAVAPTAAPTGENSLPQPNTRRPARRSGFFGIRNMGIATPEAVPDNTDATATSAP